MQMSCNRVEMNVNECEKISLYNPENDTIYEVYLSPEDAQRANNDMAFASLLLAQAMKEKEDNITLAELEDTGTAVEAAPADETAPAVQASSQEDLYDASGSLYRWSTTCVLLLLETYRNLQEKLTDGKQSHKRVWEEIAGIVNAKGHSVTGPQCASKLRSLKKTYKAVKDHNKKSGNDRRTWQFFEIMDEVFAKSAWCSPVALASSSGISAKSSCTNASGSDSGCDDKLTPKKTTSMMSLLAKRLRLKEKNEEEKAKRHKERMDMEERRFALDSKLVSVLENLLKKGE